MIVVFSSYAQQLPSRLQKRTFDVVRDTLHIDSVSISPYHFNVFDAQNKQIDSTSYSIDFVKSQLVIDGDTYPQITIEYQSLPDFLTRDYSVFDRNLIVPKTTDLSRLYKAQTTTRKQLFQPLEGLNTSGNISRGVTVGSNQDAVVNSNLDLQLSGNLSENVQIRASITDSNIPLQENGYTQRLDEFDRVFIELLSKNWSVKAGDINLFNYSGRFLRFNKKVAGVAIDANIRGDNDSIGVFASGALVRGQFATNTFAGQDGNQGPYKITGTGTEQYVLIISGSETVYVNGLALKRGENNDYIIDYNTAELTFMPTYPVTSNMRITVEYQVADRNFARFVSYDGINYKSDNLKLGFKFYNENDMKSQTLQQDLTDSQKEILALAGDDKSQMVVPSASTAVFEKNKILYKKEVIAGQEVYVFSNDPEDNLYNVRFTYVGQGGGDYRIQTTIATGRIFEYAAPQNGIQQGAYSPVVQLVAPNKLQMALFDAEYKPGEKTNITTELAFSNADANLFSSMNDNNNTGFAGNIDLDQQISDGAWKLSGIIGYEFVYKYFKTVERFRNVEFQRDWDILNMEGTQHFLTTGLDLAHATKGKVLYRYGHLDFGDNFNGNRHTVAVRLHLDSTRIYSDASYLKSHAATYKTSFIRSYNTALHSFGKKWIGVKFNSEHNERIDRVSQRLSPTSHKFIEYEGYFGIGDTAKVFSEIGYNRSKTDSVRINSLQQVNKANTWFLRSKLIDTKLANLAAYINYRTVDREDRKDEILNSRLSYGQQLFNNAISLQTVYETNSGSIPQQEYSYVEVDTGMGYYTWIDYNNNGIQELDEFEVANFQDEADYVRILLPTINFIRTNQNKFSQAVTINASQWANSEGLRKTMSHFINQSSVLFDGKRLRNNGRFNFNPFINGDNLLASNFNLKNSLYFNRGRQHYSTTYTYLKSSNKNTYSISEQELSLWSHQLQFNHKLGKFWLTEFLAVISNTKSRSMAFSNRNYGILNYELNPKFSYILNPNTRFEILYHFKDKSNNVGLSETLKSHTIGSNGRYASGKRFSLQASFNMILNDFHGIENSAVAYQMLEGLRKGTNFAWNLSLQKSINSYLDLNISYIARKSEQTKAIHTGSVQVRASF